MQIKNFFKKLFSSENETTSSSSSPRDIIFRKETSREIISVKFFLLVMAEHSGEKQEYASVKGLIQSYFQSCPEDKAFDLTSFANAVTDFTNSSESIAENFSSVYQHIYQLFEALEKDQQLLFYRDCAPIAFLYKADEATLNLGETFVYRISQLEKFSKLSKSELIAVFEEAKEVAKAG